MSYSELSIEERATIQVSLRQGMSLRQIAHMLRRSPSTLSREVRRNQTQSGAYCAHSAQTHRCARRMVCRPKRKLLLGSERFELVIHMLRNRLSPEKIAGKLKRMMTPTFEDASSCCLLKNHAQPERLDVIYWSYGMTINHQDLLNDLLGLLQSSSHLHPSQK